MEVQQLQTLWSRTALQFALLLALFLIDLCLPLGVAVWVLYLVPLAMAAWATEEMSSFVVAALGTPLIILGYFGSPPGINPTLGAANRALMIGALWSSALFLFWMKKAMRIEANELRALREAKQEAEASAQQLQAVLDAEPACVTLLSADGLLLEMNRAGLAMVEAERIEQLRQEPLSRLLPPENRESFFEFVRRVSAGEPGEIEFEMIGLRGTRRMIESYAVPFDDPRRGRVVLAVSRDVTERQRAEQDRQRFIDVLEASLNEIYIFSAQTLKFEYVNASARRNLGYTLEQLRVMTPLDLKPEFTAASFQERIGPLLRGEARRIDFETVHRRADGTLYPVQVQLQLVRQGQARRFLAVILDVTEHRQTRSRLQQTAARLESMLDVARLLGSTVELPPLLEGLCQHLRKLTPGADLCAMLLRDPGSGSLVAAMRHGFTAGALERMRHAPEETIVAEALRLRHAQLIVGRHLEFTSPNGLAQESALTAFETENGRPLLSLLCVPLIAGDGQPLGVILLGSTGALLTLDDLLTIEGIAAQTSVAVSRSRMFEELRASHVRLRALSRQLIAAQESERRRVAVDLHDQLGQLLTAISLQLHRAREACEGPSLQALDQCIAAAAEALQQVRAMSLALRPLTLDLLGLHAALETLVAQHRELTGTRINFDCRLESARLPPELEISIFRIVQESLTNVARHAQARHVSVNIVQDDAGVHLTVADDGKGFDLNAARQDMARGAAFGLLGMQQRAELVGGQLEILASSGGGTSVRAHFPVVPDERAQAGMPQEVS